MNHTDRKSEERYLEETRRVIDRNLEEYGGEVARMQAEIDEMLEHYHDNDVELWTLLNNTITLNDHMKRALTRNEKARSKPYFGRIVFRDETLGKEESLYIGKGGISRDKTNWVVVDWRAPVANTYYENGLGKCSYTAPGGKELPIDLQLKRTYEIEDGKLLDYYDTEVVANDDLLTKYLSRNKEAVLGEIVATIQKEQNEIIRKSPYHNVIVQGVAGSGKTTVAMHRISFILYNYQERFRPEDFYIVGSNRILLNYITGVLPDLDVYGVKQMTMEQLFIRLLYEDWDEKKYSVRPVFGTRDAVKGKESWFQDLEAFIRRLEQASIRREDVFLYPRQFVEGLWDGKSRIFDRREEDRAEGKPLTSVRIADRDAVERYIVQNPAVSIQSKINMLNDRLIVKIQEEFLGKGVKYTEEERKAILRAYRGYYGPSRWKGSIYDLYRKFLAEQREKGLDVAVPSDSFDVYDLAALALLYKWVKETEVISEAHHIVVDEAQDFGMMAYLVLHACIRDCTYTVMGDVSQNIHFGYGLGDWEALRRLLLPDAMDSFGVLRKSYRNTVEISRFATEILRHGSFSIYPAEPIIRHGREVAVERLEGSDHREAAGESALKAETQIRKETGESAEALAKRAAEICRSWQEQGYDTIAVVCRDVRSAAETAELLAKHIEIMESDLEKLNFGSGIMVLPVEYTKGLEFDTVLIWDPVRADYPSDDGHAKLLYVAATRALHELHILYRGDLTGLIADPVPEKDAKDSDYGCGNISDQEKRPLTEQRFDCGGPEAESEQAEKRQRSGRRTNPGQEILAQAQTEGLRPDENKTLDGETGNIQQDIKPESAGRTGKNPDTGDTEPESGKTGISRPRIKISPKIIAVTAQPRLAGGIGNMAPDSASGSTVRSALGLSETESGSRRSDSRFASVSPFSFGDMPPTESLRPAGHARINSGVRWVSRQEDGLYLQSAYGTMRLCPVSGSILRITFARSSAILAGTHPLIAVDKSEKNWKYRDNGKILELSAGEVRVSVEKASGALTYLDGRGKTLLAEKRQESRQLEKGKQWLFLDWQKGEQLFAMPPVSDREALKLRGSAYYLSDGRKLPFLLSDRGYGILPVSSGAVVCCDIPAYGSYLCTEGEQQDYYFIAGNQRNIRNAYDYLCGVL
ncbi:MAG: AAA family ATPase [Roseburia sp.]|nr:AAA family ATPase [Roseburia sp.]MCM1099526.1 AAA family ATPase [Ruminococcus flavefaciens]